MLSPLTLLLVIFRIAAANLIAEVAQRPISGNLTTEARALNFLKCMEVNGFHNNTPVLTDTSGALVIYANSTFVNITAVNTVFDMCTSYYSGTLAVTLAVAETLDPSESYYASLGDVLSGRVPLPALTVNQPISGEIDRTDLNLTRRANAFDGKWYEFSDPATMTVPAQTCCLPIQTNASQSRTHSLRIERVTLIQSI
ncbi:hypothetical protein KAFR_0H00780 [Kazachstania africana CBS 2517]|uniref:Uncharacterized protein n=1 Tax=Kazachstania africana (strain ATCC 22294 / BCRC 22015 / CBS 2517 / CECT 1963 / NBRC 1671 / NRRL Y-8276) TaxID=1071382 RepID=H2AYT1_KAZAF|nr:hypothetical protein KAFR_0H00780 [Kazachstania africana CBS 2517]CCF59487.1 hypothetical protein KAFR_0H00780 [Kazachstania africana CBS 2517]